MSEKFREAAISALKRAYEGYLNRDWEVYHAALGEARRAIDNLRGLGRDPDHMGRELEVLYLSGEEMLMAAFSFVGKPDEMCMCYELAEYYLTVLSSRILTKDAAFLPRDIDLMELFPLPDEAPEEAMEKFSKAMEIYRRLTGGGDGADMLYRAALYCQMGDICRAESCIAAARAQGGAWLLPHANRLEEQLREIRRKGGEDGR